MLRKIYLVPAEHYHRDDAALRLANVKGNVQNTA